ncbi:hypothetical protein ACFWFI_42460 [Streptomyces sp. NPDC060209]|uniref:hypothetical protein n=1 Tax=Streptomyces sp. NPDC060209 TaxID=3347073 RepID=UPI0036577F8A
MPTGRELGAGRDLCRHPLGKYKRTKIDNIKNVFYNFRCSANRNVEKRKVAELDMDSRATGVNLMYVDGKTPTSPCSSSCGERGNREATLLGFPFACASVFYGFGAGTPRGRRPEQHRCVVLLAVIS